MRHVSVQHEREAQTSPIRLQGETISLRDAEEVEDRLCSWCGALHEIAVFVHVQTERLDGDAVELLHDDSVHVVGEVDEVPLRRISE